MKGKGDKTRFGVISKEFFDRLSEGLSSKEGPDENQFLFRREKGATLSAIQKTLGHESIKITGRYLETEISDVSEKFLTL